MATTPRLDRPPSPPEPTRHGDAPRRRAPVVAVLTVLAVLGLALAAAVAMGLFGSDDPSPDASIGEPAEDPAIGPPVGAPLDVEYGEESRANWDVTGVPAGGELEVREVPGP